MARESVESVFGRLKKVSSGDLTELESVEVLSYLTSYPVFLKFFQARPRIDRDTVILGASLIYSWMPTGLTLFDGIDRTAEILESVRKGEDPTEEDLDQVASTVNNSMVGASKLLHFIQPERFPIYDSRVARFLGWPIYASAMRSVDRYQEYRALCGELVERPGFEKLAAGLSAQCGKVSRLRAVELLMFLGGAK